MAGVLELAQLAEHHHVTQVDVGRRRVDAELDTQGATLLQTALELALRECVDRVSEQAFRHRRNARIPRRRRDVRRASPPRPGPSVSATAEHSRSRTDMQET